jgi:putative peptide zinc metalloprotease protein
MLVNSTLAIYQYDDKRWVVQTAEGRNILVNQPTASLIQILSESESVEVARETFCVQFCTTISTEKFAQLIYEKIGGYQILVQDTRPLRPEMPQYLSMKVPLLKPSIAGFLAKPLTIFYGKDIFWKILSVVFVFCLVNFIYGINHFPRLISGTNYWVVISLLYMSLLFHELGHIAACARCGIKHGEIGFGFYFIFPVVYADITKIWTAKKQERIIANLAGIFAEIIYCCLLFISFLITDDLAFWVAFASVFSKALLELNPFVRYDGYWILSDLTNTPNLLAKANRLVSLTQLKKFIFDRKSASKSDYWLFLYGSINMFFFFGYFCYMISFYGVKILNFPITIYNVFFKLITLSISWQDLKMEYLLIFFFYILIFRYLKRLVTRFF